MNHYSKVVMMMCCVLFLVVGITTLQAQTTLVKGKVTQSSNAEGIPGVSILVKGTNIGTLSNVEGAYELSVAAGGTLVFSSVGFTTQEIPVGNRNELNVALVEDSKHLVK